MSSSQVQSVLSRELLSSELEPLEKDFYKKALQAVKEAERAGDRVTAELLKNSVRLLFLLRLQKELRRVAEGEDVPQNIPEEEKAVIDFVRGVLSSLGEPSAAAEKQVKLQTLEESAPEARREEGVLVAFLKPYPRIVDKGLTLGPFKAGDVARIPKRIAEELSKENYVEVIG
uniref:Gins51 C-terminal domain-containing protein n=1 Tax=Thermofilum pendens TaxID=2269 RepID=A0A7C1SMS5_THEPE